VARAEAYLLAKFHLDPSNRLATVQRYRQTGRTNRQDRQTDNGRPQSLFIHVKIAQLLLNK